MRTQAGFRVWLLPVFGALAACGGGGGGGGGSSNPPVNTWHSGVFRPSSTFDNMCANPRPGTADRQGTRTDENNFLRSWSNELYLWYGEITDVNPANYATLDYFDLLKTNATTPSGNPKDKFHFTYDTAAWDALSQGGTSAGYGAQFDLEEGPASTNYVPRHVRVAYVDPGTPAVGQLTRGDEILTVDGADVINSTDRASIDKLNAGLFPGNTGVSHTFHVRSSAGVERDVTMVTANVTSVPVQNVTTFSTASGPVGYIQFNDHIATAEGQLKAAFTTLKNAGVTDLILDIRYNGGGYLDMASEVAYMIANTTLTSGRTFEKLVFNDKNPSKDPVTGETLTPTPFHSTTQGFQGSGVTAGQPLPTLNLNNVYLITGPGTCSASESIINSLRGVGVNVYLIGSTTCGKPYGFYPQDNCGTTYFTIEFRGENAANFGDYPDGFSPANQVSNRGVSVPGCSVYDDFSHQLGDASEARIATALAFRASNNQNCPAATGFSPPRLAKASLKKQSSGFAFSLPDVRSNRIIRPTSRRPQ